ncbi:LysR family transcriptional regulator [Rhodobium gokarnense]|uniref:DNA-binding transcriptional LysR family regulator n=1 Tax=Rhodobium gokarnense TaxID=364296 RepID=A0ABT3HER4_9HYPH|nr:LysR family transcriptional regulator [Rhodobium gokarnense]MCW2308887.1 DNA-binding transcriptional LysR family regulator [Rhodobium gokarnense]
MNLSVRQLNYVLTAARLRSISKAAESLHISQSSVSSAINKLEAGFNVTIFVRQQSKGLIVTAVGAEVLGRIGRLLSEIDSFEEDLSGFGQALEGTINVGCFAPVSPHFLPTIISDVSRQYPKVQVNLHEGDLQQVQEFLRDGTADIVLTYDLGIRHPFKTEALTAVPPHVVLARNDPLAGRRTVSLAEMMDRPMILLDLPESRTYFELLFDTVGAHPRIVYRTMTYEMVRSLVATGLGFSVLNLRPVTEHTYIGEDVVCLPIRERVLAPNIILARRAHDFTTRLMRAFSDACRDYFRSDLAAKHIVLRR